MMSDNMCLLVYHYIFEQLTIIPKPSILGVCGCSGYTSKFYEYNSMNITLNIAHWTTMMKNTLLIFLARMHHSFGYSLFPAAGKKTYDHLNTRNIRNFGQGFTSESFLKTHHFSPDGF